MTSSPPPTADILISGAGIAGPALAYWLRRHGFNPTVVERAPALRGGGYAVDFRGPVHLDLLSRMGIRDDVERARTGTRGDRTEYLFGDSIATMDETAAGVYVTFEKSAPPRTTSWSARTGCTRGSGRWRSGRSGRT